MKLYVVKYCLTTGIFQTEVEDGNHRPGDLVREVVDGKLGWNFFKYGRDAVDTKEEAEKLAKKMASKKKTALLKQLEKVRALEVKPKWIKEES